MRHLERGADLAKPLFAFLGRLPRSFCGRRDAKRPEQVSRGPSRVTRLAEDRVQSLLGQVVKDQVDDAPGVKGLGLMGRGRLVVSVHEPTQRRLAQAGSLNLRQCPATWGLL